MRNINTTKQSISPDSLWITATPAPYTRTLPFFALEAGHFFSSSQYKVSRLKGSGYLFFYTISKNGMIRQADADILLPERHAAVIHCEQAHSYQAGENGWEFLWFYLEGSGMKAMFDLLYPNGPAAIELSGPHDPGAQLEAMMQDMKKNDVRSVISMSARIHQLFNELLYTAMEQESGGQKKNCAKDIQQVLDFIKAHYAEQITLDDMVASVHVSKYHFIRLFQREMGMAPYRCLTNYRINKAKQMLCTTPKSVAEIAADCGFLDTSQFIRHFKKFTETTPLQYRMNFRPLSP